MQFGMRCCTAPINQLQAGTHLAVALRRIQTLPGLQTRVVALPLHQTRHAFEQTDTAIDHLIAGRIGIECNFHHQIKTRIDQTKRWGTACGAGCDGCGEGRSGA